MFYTKIKGFDYSNWFKCVEYITLIYVNRKDFHPLCKSMNAYIMFEEEKSANRALKRSEIIDL